MTILTIRTDKPESEIGLFDDSKKLEYISWEAHRELSATIHKKIYELLQKQSKAWQDLSAIICYKGPGSFTGLRIGVSVANTLADNLQIPIIGSQENDWITKGIQAVEDGKNDQITVPEYGRDPHITVQKK